MNIVIINRNNYINTFKTKIGSTKKNLTDTQKPRFNINCFKMFWETSV